VVGMVRMGRLFRKVYILSGIIYITMQSLVEDMKIKEVAEDIGERELLVRPLYRKVDKYGRLFVGIDQANKETIALLAIPTKEDKLKYLLP
jgi:hypothetical protein